MGIFNFFKKIPEVKKAEEIKSEKLELSELKIWIENKKKDNLAKEKEILGLIHNKIAFFTNEIKGNLIALKAVNLDSRKAEEKIKFIVTESRKKYMEFIEIFLENLNDLEMENLEKSINDVNSLFLSFNNRLHVSYEKTTLLIGKEMAEVKNCLKEFSRELINLFNNSKEIIESSKVYFLLESNLNQLPVLNENIKVSHKSINLLKDKMIGKNEEHKQLSEEIEKFKKSETYLQYLKDQENLKFLEENLKKEYSMLKQLFDFKALSSFFHADPEKMRILKNYKEEFQPEFEKENGKTILDLAGEADLNTEKILEKIVQIQFKLNELNDAKQKFEQDPAKEMHSKLIGLIREITDLEMELFREEKKYEKLNANKSNLLESLKQEMKQIGAELI